MKIILNILITNQKVINEKLNKKVYKNSLINF